VLHHRSGVFRYEFPLYGEIQDALQALQLSIYRCSFDRPIWVEFCWLPATLIAILLDHFDGNSVQLGLPEKCFPLFQIGAMTSHGVLGEDSKVGPLEFRTQVLERSPLPWPPDLEQSQHDLALAFLPVPGELVRCQGSTQCHIVTPSKTTIRQPQAVGGGFFAKPPGNWQPNKIFLGGDEGEVFVNINPVMRKGQFSIKDPDYGDIVLGYLASVL
jgi:hypothetical protein